MFWLASQGTEHVRPPFQGGFSARPNPGLKAWAMVFYRFAVISSAFAALASIPSSGLEPPSASTTSPSQETAIQPGTVIAGYPIAPTYTLSRYDEDYSFLANPAYRTEPLDLIKYIPLFDWGPLYFVSLGGDIREQYEFIENDNFGLGSVNNHGYWLQRLMWHSDWHFGPLFRAFVQFKSSEEEGRSPGPRPIDRKRLDFNQAFVDFSYPQTNLLADKSWFTLRLGRQMIDLGDERLIAIRAGPNTEQSFDGARLILNWLKARVDLFALWPDEDRSGYFNNNPSQSHESVWGVYSTYPLTTKSTAATLNNIGLDLFYIGFHHDGAHFNAGVGTEVRQSIGGRLWRAHHINGLDFNLLGVYQFGSFDGKQISAFSVAIDAGYKLFNLPGAPRVACSLQVSSGSSSLQGSRLETFNAMFPAGYYYGGGLVGQVGPANAIILQPELDLHPTSTLGVYLKALFVWREDTADGLYNTPGFLILSGTTNSQRYVGWSPELLISQQIGRHLSVSSSYYHFFRGAFLTDNQLGTKDVDYFSAWMSYTF
ncbi:MAG: alginate export family protein [Verrucomicrobia bacterium]|nr:alginate export family protein [Verrucomicrobiota bacterium]